MNSFTVDFNNKKTKYKSSSLKKKKISENKNKDKGSIFISISHQHDDNIICTNYHLEPEQRNKNDRRGAIANTLIHNEEEKH
ncbi:hypothetical protein DERP_005890 [Dermatophagoides pteronyssinus]|uniref:Uncharacterized protein n=1 Tax=Dermatophagoides pteronyssinus TaxID=6956 RepID=A0ABQ8J9U0_DERPT|nr:hypothetical protein DERP_005890 [Dermatophagoides pteronyssinus]